jgi:hypothetical protein
MASKFPLIPVSLLIEDDSDSLRALVKKAKAAPAAPKKEEPSKTPTSRKSMALSQLAKAFKAKKDTDKDKPKSGAGAPGLPGLPPEKSKSDSKLKAAADALSKSGGGSASPHAPAGGHGVAGPDDASVPAKPSAMAKAAGAAAARPSIKDPHMDVEHPPGKHEAFHHDEPSLKERTRPDVIPFDERHQDFQDRYHSKDASLKEMEYLHGSANAVFRGKMDDDTHYVMKPHEAGVQQFDPKHWAKRHNAVARLLSHMGADHMISPAMDTKGHGGDMMPGDHPSAESHGEFSAHSHAGKEAFVGEWAPNTIKSRHASEEQKDKVDGDHRLMGMVTHLVTHNSDGHGGNVLIDTEHGHPVLIDQDLTMALGAKRGQAGLSGLRSVFAPGGEFDYQAKMGKVGNKFPPRIKKTLEWLAGGGHHHPEGGLDVHDNDKKVMQKMAKAMLDHGLEKTINSVQDWRPR